MSSHLASTACLFSRSSTSRPSKSYSCAPFIVMELPSCLVCLSSASLDPMSNVGSPDSPPDSLSFSVTSS